MLKRLFGWQDGSESDSNWRRVFSRISMVFVALMLLEAAFDVVDSQLGLVLLGYFALAWALFFFMLVVFLQPLRSSTHFEINARRLLLDTLISAAMLIMALSVIYRLYGIHPPAHLDRGVVATDAVYFSTVTFSTLGFGDFAPIGWSKFFAAAEALLGNIHLGFVVGSIFVIVGRVFNR